jgi:prevent-host-death family protein
MESVSVSELKKSPSGYFRKVKAGEEILVTDRGHPFAKIVPLRRDEAGEGTNMAKLEAAGLARVGKGFQADFWAQKGPVDPEGAVRTALIEEREER